MLSLIERGEPMGWILDELDRRIRDVEGCDLRAFRGLLVAVSEQERPFLRLARRVSERGCTSTEGWATFLEQIRHSGTRLGLGREVKHYFSSRRSPDPFAASLREIRLEAAAGFRAGAPFRASLSPSGRFLAIASPQGPEMGQVEVWDLVSGRREQVFSEPLTYFPAFLDERFWLTSGALGLVVRDRWTGQ
ncbi:MAG: hypothetical protein AAGD06_27225, partial [Acidobacteriota bacterium]